MNTSIIEDLKIYYGIEVSNLEPLSSEVYKVETRDGKTFFLKLNPSHFNPDIFNLLASYREVVHPIMTLGGKFFQQAGESTYLLYPFIEGQDGINRALSNEQWIKLGQVLKKIHQIEIPSHIQIRQEDFSPRWHEVVRSFLNIQGDAPLLKFLRKNRLIIEYIVQRAEELKESAKSQKKVLCHSDIYGGNIILDGESLFIVDWDNPILAPKERDLLFISEGTSKFWNMPIETKLFYQGYGQIEDKVLSYYRFEQIVQDIAVFSHAILSESQDKTEIYKQFLDMFAENGVIEIAFKYDHR